MESKNLVKILIAVVILIILFRMLNCKRSMKEKFAPVFPDRDELEEFTDFDPADVDENPSVEGFTQASKAPVFTNAPLSTSVDLLPKPVQNSVDFGEFAPKNLGTQNFVDSTKFIGVDTVGSSLRNANYSIRRDPPIPKSEIGPWAQSTIEADLWRKNGGLDC